MNRELLTFVGRGIQFLAVFAVVILLANFAFNTLVVSQKISQRQADNFLTYTRQYGSEFDYAFFGDSHPHEGILPKYIQGSYNFAGRNNAIDTYLQLKRLLDSGTVLKTIVLPYDDQTYTAVELGADYIPEEWPEDLNESREAMDELSGNLSRNVWLRSKFPLIGGGNDLFLITLHRTELALDGSIVNMGKFSDLSPSDRLAKAQDVATAYYGYGTSQGVSPLLGRYLAETLQLAKEKNLRVIFIRYPVTDEYRMALRNGNITTEGYYYALNSTIAQVLGSNYTVLDYSTYLAGKDSYFRDPGHLNYYGATEFSKQLNADLASLKQNQGAALYMSDSLKKK
jgi:hypothetical protein